MPADVPEIQVDYRFDGGFSWRRAGSGLLECRSHAMCDDEGRTWLFDPLGGVGLDEELDQLGGEVAGVIVLLDRHIRDSEMLAHRYGARLLVPPGRWRRGHAPPPDAESLADEVQGCPFRFSPLVERGGQWLEWAAWWSERRILVVPEAVGTASYYRSRLREPLAVHPVLRLVAPPRSLLELPTEEAPELLLVGHGPPLDRQVDASVELAVGESRRELPWYLVAAPRHVVRWARAGIGLGRASC